MFLGKKNPKEINRHVGCKVLQNQLKIDGVNSSSATHAECQAALLFGTQE